jgi:hypothetical protein
MYYVIIFEVANVDGFFFKFGTWVYTGDRTSGKKDGQNQKLKMSSRGSFLMKKW